MGCKYNQKTALTTSVFIKIELFVPLQNKALSIPKTIGRAVEKK